MSANSLRPSGAWMTPRRTMSTGRKALTSSPSKMMVPVVSTVREMDERVVVLPTPLGPRIATSSPSSKSISSMYIAGTLLYDAVRFRTSRRAIEHLHRLGPQVCLDHILIFHNFFGSAIRNLLAKVHHYDFVHQPHQGRKFVLHHDNRQPPCRQAANHVVNARYSLVGQAGKRFVEKEDIRRGSHHPADIHEA